MLRTMDSLRPDRQDGMAEDGGTVPPPVALRASVVVCAYSDARWEQLSAALASVAAQDPRPAETVLVVDHNPVLLERARAAFPGVSVVPNAQAQGLSGARNTGVRHSTGDVVAFLDDDARAEGGWLRALLRAFEDPSVIGAGGLVAPDWTSGRPSWFPEEMLWVVGCSYRGLPTVSRPVRNPIGASMAFRRHAFTSAGEFALGIGRLEALPLGCEETELAIRVRRANPDSTILHVPDAVVRHSVAPERATWRYFTRRCWAEGLSKALVARHVGSADGLASERTYAAVTLPAGMLRGLADGARGDGWGLLRAGAIVAGLVTTVAGYVAGCLRRSRR